MSFLPTIIYRRRKENKKKCSLKGLEGKKEFSFFSYPKEPLPDISSYILLTIDAPLLSIEDRHKGLLLLDASWHFAAIMEKKVLQKNPIEKRSLPPQFITAYPRYQTDCSDPKRGLASIEAIFLAYYITKRDTSFLLDNYHWKEKFLTINSLE